MIQTAARTAAAPTRAAAPALTLDERLALAHHAMDDRLATAGVRIAVNLAGHPIPDSNPGQPIHPAWQPAHQAPLARLLETAGHLIATRGWGRRWLTGDAGELCARGALEAAGRLTGASAADAEQVLLDAIRLEQPDVQSVPAWNDSQSDPQPVLRMFALAARKADQ